MRSLKHNLLGNAGPAPRTDVSMSVASSPVRFEALESRQLMSITAPAPGDGNDYTFVDDVADAGTPAITASAEQFRRTPMPGGFKWFDATTGRLSGAAPGVFQSMALDGYMIWPPDLILGGVNKRGATSEAGTRALARQTVATGCSVVVIDIEEWNLDVRSGARGAVDDAIARFRQVLGWVRDERPQLKIGIYGYLSISDDGSSTQLERYQQAAAAGSEWHAANIPQASSYFASWQIASDYLKTIAQDCDYVFPSIYTGSTDVNDWINYAKAMITDSRRFGKPVIPFIWPQYHNAVAGVGLQFLPPSMWQTQLDIVRDMAESCVIWMNPNYLTSGNGSWVTQTVAKAQQDVGVTPAAAPGAVEALPATPSDDDDASDDSLDDAIDEQDVVQTSRRRVFEQVLGGELTIV